MEEYEVIDLIECDHCGIITSCFYGKDPLLDEVHNEAEWSFWCTDCYDNRKSEV